MNLQNSKRNSLKTDGNRFKTVKDMPCSKQCSKHTSGNCFNCYFFNLLASLCDAVMPFFLREIMAYIEEDSTSDDSIWEENFFQNMNSHTSVWRALIFVGLMLFTLFFARILRENLAFMQLKIGVQANQALSGMIYSKILKVSSATNKFYKKGDIVSYIQVDAPKVIFLFDTLPEVSRIPFLLIFLIISLYMFIEMTFLAAIGVVVVFGVLNYYIAKWTALIQIDRMKKFDKRTNRISEVIDNIKLIKFNSWIEKFLDKVFKARSKEIRVIVKKLLMWTVNITVMNLNYPVLAISVFLIAIFGVKLSVAVPTALAILQILNSLHSSSYSLPLFIGDFVEFLVSMKRIQSFLKCDEIEEDAIIHDKRAFDNLSITVKNSNFFWGFDEKQKKRKKLVPEEDKEKEEVKEDLEIQKSKEFLIYHRN
jgi:ABC-type multidrug transport system fused ATPase/permease subunit